RPRWSGSAVSDRPSPLKRRETGLGTLTERRAWDLLGLPGSADRLTCSTATARRPEDAPNMAKKTVPAPPNEALPDGESNRYLAMLKSSLGERCSLPRMAPL